MIDTDAGRPTPRMGRLLSVVIPMFNEESVVPTLLERLRAVLDPIELRYELVLVDDGSSDGTVTTVRAYAAVDDRFKVIELSRNFGHQAAISAGLDYAKGDAVVVMDADLQDPPEAIPDFLAKWREGYDVVYAVRRARKEPWYKRGAYWVFYRMLRRISNVDVPADSGDFGLIDRRVVNLLRQMPERNRFLRGLRSWVGLRQVGIPVVRQARSAGDSKYTLGKLRHLAMDGFVSFSYAPLRLATRAGFVISGVGFLFAGWVIVLRLGWGIAVSGWASLVVVVIFLGGVQLITTGILGEYIGRIYDEVKRRPLYVVSQTTNIDTQTLQREREDGESVERRL